MAVHVWTADIGNRDERKTSDHIIERHCNKGSQENTGSNTIGYFMRKKVEGVLQNQQCTFNAQ